MPIAIDIIENTVYIAEGNVTAGGVEIHKSDEIRLPEGTVEDGDIKNRSALVTSISKILKAHSFKSKSAVVTFTSSMAITRRLSLPFGKMKEIAGMVKNQIAQSVGDPADYVFEFSFAGGEKVKSSEIDVWAFAIEKELVDKYYSIFKSIKLRPAALDIHPNCIQKAIQGSTINGQDLNGKSTLFVDIEREFVEIHLFNGYMREFSRIAPVSAS
ncbi:MAG TPA: pilus assembly protein PilM, partial [Ruminiclostridium sp.]|nr:pilus assembly protein PilM [Ruminiclostridium sp.]